MARSALEVVTLYNLEVWNKGRIELVRELCAERMTRYDANSVTTLGIDEQIARIRHNYDELRPTFEPVVLAGDDEYVTLVWNVTGRDPNWKWCGIEVFRVVDGKIVEVWNGPYVNGRWIRGGTLHVGFSGDKARTLPVMSASIEGDRGQLVAPLDSDAIALWLTATFGAPDCEANERRFRWGDRRAQFDLGYAQHGRPPQGLSSATVERLEIRWARSGLTNVTIDLAGTAGVAPEPSATDADRGARLAECTGRVFRAGQPAGKIVGASIALDPATQTASGELTIRIPASTDARAICGEATIAFGWHGERSALRFEATASLSDPDGAFTDGEEAELVVRWTAADITAALVCEEQHSQQTATTE